MNSPVFLSSVVEDNVYLPFNPLRNKLYSFDDFSPSESGLILISNYIPPIYKLNFIIIIVFVIKFHLD